jgi:hypothetical protein
MGQPDTPLRCRRSMLRVTDLGPVNQVVATAAIFPQGKADRVVVVGAGSRPGGARGPGPGTLPGPGRPLPAPGRMS